MRQFLLLLSLLHAGWLWADVTTCNCDPKRPETMEARNCSLSREAEKQPADVEVFVLKDANPTKPGRWLVLPRRQDRSLDMLPAELRAKLWAAAIAVGKAKFGDDWALAYNAPSVQTQCHVHIHVGKLINGVENSQFITVTKIEDIPVPAKGEGIWVHPQGNLFHVHTGEQITETTLLR